MNTLMRASLRTLAATVAVLLIAPSSGWAQTTPATLLAPTGTLRVSFLGTNPVQGRIDPRTQEVSGLVADLTRALAERLGVPSRIIPVPNADALITSVDTGQSDVGFLAWEEERARRVEFSAPYLLMGNSYLVKVDSPFRRSSDVDREGVTVGAVSGTSQGIWVTQHLTKAQRHMVPAAPPAADLIAMLTSGQIGAFAANRQRMEEAAATSAQVRVLPDTFSAVGQALVVQKGNVARVAELDRFVRDAIASGLVKQSATDARLTGVEVAPLP